MQHQLIHKPAFTIVGYSIRTQNVDGQNNRDIPAFWQRYMQEKLGANLHGLAVSTAEYGICDDFDMETGEFSYVIGVEAGPDAVVPDGAIMRSYPEQLYAVFTTPKAGPDKFTEAIQNTWAVIFGEWFPGSGYRHAPAAEFEYYDERCWSDRNELLEMDIYIPVQELSEP